VFGQLENHLSIFVDIDTDATLAIGVVDATMPQLHVPGALLEYFSEPIAASTGSYSREWRAPTAAVWEALLIDTHDRAEHMGCCAVPLGFMLVGRVLSEVRSDGTGWNAFTAFVGSDGTHRSVQRGRC